MVFHSFSIIDLLYIEKMLEFKYRICKTDSDGLDFGISVVVSAQGAVALLLGIAGYEGDKTKNSR